jgi:hypothetical protein
MLRLEQSIGEEGQGLKVTRSLPLEKRDNAIIRPIMVSIIAAHRAWGIGQRVLARSRQLEAGSRILVQGARYRKG